MCNPQSTPTSANPSSSTNTHLFLLLLILLLTQFLPLLLTFTSLHLPPVKNDSEKLSIWSSNWVTCTCSLAVLFLLVFGIVFFFCYFGDLGFLLFHRSLPSSTGPSSPISPCCSSNKIISIFYLMMQFTETSPLIQPYDLYQNNGVCLGLDIGATVTLGSIINRSDSSNFSSSSSSTSSRPWPELIMTSSKSIGTLINSGSCTEQLLVHCANAIESNDATLAQQILWVLNNIASSDGDSNQRLTSAFLRALINRASRTGSCKLLTAAVTTANEDLLVKNHRFTAVALASFIDLTPWHRFGYTAANAAIVEAVEGFSVVHIVDLTTTHCMQMPTLIDALASRAEGPPLLIRLTVPILTSPNPPPPPLLDVTYDELGSRLVNFARSRNVLMEFKPVHSDPSDAFVSLIETIRVHQLVTGGSEALVVNCQMLLHMIPDETAGAIHMTSSSSSWSSPFMSLRTMFLKSLRSLEPVVVTLVDEDIDFVSNDLVGRLTSAFNYLWMPYDAVDTFLPRGSERRDWYEADVCWKVENVIAQEGLMRVERQESRSRWIQRMIGVGFRRVPFGDEAVVEVKGLLDEHAAGWGLRKEEDDLVLTWKGHNVVFATTWLPIQS